MKLPLMIRQVRGPSMEPTLPAGKYVVAIRRANPKAGQVVIIIHEGKEKIKRINEVDGAHVYLLGDNPEMSKDSRDFGLVLSNTIIATVIWPRRKLINDL